ncbi:MAG: YceI family protein [Pseudomonadota bacterium]
MDKLQPDDRTQPLARAVTRPKRYSDVAIWLHWLIAGGIVLQFVLANLAEAAEAAGSRLQLLGLVANHKSVGMSVLGLAAIRLLWRLTHPTPALPQAMPLWQKLSSNLTHVLLYGLLFALPISGWLMSSASAYSVSWFGLLTFPDLISPSRDTVATMKTVHDFLAKGLFAIAVLHIGAALKHFVIDKDKVLQRMSSLTGYVFFTLTIVGGMAVLGSVGAPVTAQETPPQPVSSQTVNVPEAAQAIAKDAVAQTLTDTTNATVAQASAVTANSAAQDTTPSFEANTPATTPLPAPWVIDYNSSYIQFTAYQAGAAFNGRWEQWQADLRFDSESLEQSEFDVRITISGVNTQDAERDQTLLDSEWFDAAQFPQVQFKTRNFAAKETGFTATATLTVKGTAHPVMFNFTITQAANNRVLTGTATLDRLALGIGTGEWTDTEWVGQMVDVEVKVVATVE